MAKITIDLPSELLNSIDERCRRAVPLVSRSDFIQLALAEYLRVEAVKGEKERLFWAREETEEEQEERYIRGYLEQPETEEELDAWVEQASMSGLREFYKDEPPWPGPNE